MHLELGRTPVSPRGIFFVFGRRLHPRQVMVRIARLSAILSASPHHSTLSYNKQVHAVATAAATTAATTRTMTATTTTTPLLPRPPYLPPRQHHRHAPPPAPPRVARSRLASPCGAPAAAPSPRPRTRHHRSDQCAQCQYCTVVRESELRIKLCSVAHASSARSSALAIAHLRLGATRRAAAGGGPGRGATRRPRVRDSFDCFVRVKHFFSFSVGSTHIIYKFIHYLF
jgi:hypothetical protein